MGRPSRPRRRLWIGAALLLVLALPASCARGRGAAGGPEGPVLVLAADGLEWEVLLPLAAAGELPVLAGLMERGAYGLLESSRPTFSPILWTSMATGKRPGEHGIRGFVRRDGRGGKRLYTSLDRRSKAFWNVLSDYGRRVAIVGWWITYPVEPVNGVMVAQVNTVDQRRRKNRGILKGSLREGLDRQVHPPERLEEFLEVHRQVSADLPRLSEGIFGPFPHPLSPLGESLWRNTEWALLADATYAEIARRLAGEGYDLVAFYLGGADVLGHRFWRYLKPELYRRPPSPQEVENLGPVIPAYYRYLDATLGSVLERMPAGTTVIVVSDHGMEAVNQDGSFDPDEPPDDLNSAHHRRARPGVLVASGPRVRPAGGTTPLDRLQVAELPVLGSIYDLAPTLLEMLGVPPGEDMPGAAPTGLLTEPGPPRVATHETREWRAARAALGRTVAEEAADADRLEQLRALGYVQ